MLSCSAGLRQEPVILKVWRILGTLLCWMKFWNDSTVHHWLESLLLQITSIPSTAKIFFETNDRIIILGELFLYVFSPLYPSH